MGKKRNQTIRDAAKKLSSYKKKGTGPGGRIGLGLESSFKAKKVRRDEVVVDAQTTIRTDVDKSILYVQGWSLSEERDAPC